MQPGVQAPLQTLDKFGFLHVFWQKLAPHSLYTSLSWQRGREIVIGLIVVVVFGVIVVVFVADDVAFGFLNPFVS